MMKWILSFSIEESFMQALSINDVSQERRQYNSDSSVLWDRLSLTQKFSANSLTQFGYDLSFIRSSEAGSLAILLCNGSPATVDSEGDINTNPKIHIRP